MTESLDRIYNIINSLKDFNYFYEFSSNYKTEEYWQSQLYTLKNEFSAIYSGLSNEEQENVHAYLNDTINNMFNDGLLVDVDIEVVNHIKEKIKHITGLEA